MRLVASGVVVRYPGLVYPVLTGADLAAEVGTTVAVLGPSGSGKSTLLSVLGGLVHPDMGEVRVECTPGIGPLAPRDVTAWVLQTVNVLPERSALANVAVAGLARGLSLTEARDVAAARLTEVGLGSRLHDPPKILSGGEVQRVVIARALTSGRPFILADEPTGQLDRATSATVLNALFANAGGAAVVVATHDPTVAERCDRVTHIDEGRVVDG